MSERNAVTKDSLILFIRDLVADQYKSTGKSTTGALLAAKIRAAFDDFTFESVGLTKLSDAVGLAESEGYVTRDRLVQHLEVRPGPSSGVDMSTESFTADPSKMYLKPEFWRAFLFVSEDHLTFLDRRSGALKQIHSANQSEVERLSSDNSYIQLNYIPSDEQLGWLNEFIEQCDDLALEDAPLKDPKWWISVPDWIRSGSSETSLKRWRRLRAQKTVEHAILWARENNIQEDYLFSVRATSFRPSQVSTLRELQGSDREALFRAIRDMSMEELAEVRIPIKYVLRYFTAK